MEANRLKTSFWWRWGPAIVVMAAIFFFSSLPSHDIPKFGAFDFSVKKLSHMLGYVLLVQAYLHGIGKSRPKAALIAWLLTIAYAATDEFHQRFTPGRGSSIIDVGIDSIGSLLGLALPAAWRFFFPYSPNSSSKSSSSVKD